MTFSLGQDFLPWGLDFEAELVCVPALICVMNYVEVAEGYVDGVNDFFVLEMTHDIASNGWTMTWANVSLMVILF